MPEYLSNYPAKAVMYKGVTFSNLIKAQWAYFFDLLGIGWKYQKESFPVGHILGAHLQPDDEMYTPDFRLYHLRHDGTLVETNLYAEVYGPTAKPDAESLTAVHDFGGVLPDFVDSDGTDNAGLILLNPIYERNGEMVTAHPIIQHHGGLRRNYFVFNDPPYLGAAPLRMQSVAWANAYNWEQSWRSSDDAAFWSSDSISYHTGKVVNGPRVRRAYLKAFNTRFNKDGPYTYTAEMRSADSRKRKAKGK